MKNYEEEIAKAVRVEHDERTGKLFIVFEVTSEKFKKEVITSWIKDLEYKLNGKSLIENDS